MVNIPSNTVGLNSKAYLNQMNMKARTERAALEMRNQSGGNTDLLHEHTPDIYGMLSANRELSAQKTHQTNLTKANLRGGAQITTIELLSKIASEFRTRLSDGRTNGGYADDQINDWCKTQLSNIGNLLSVTEGNGQYVFAENSPFKAPINKTIIITPLPAGSNPTTDYLQGQFTGNTSIRLTKEVVKSDIVMAAHPGVQSLVCALRMGMSIDPEQYAADPASSSAIDMLSKSAIPGLASALKSAGELCNTVDRTKITVDFATLNSLEALQETAREPEAKTVQEMLEAKNLNMLQEKIIASASADSQRFSDAIFGA